MRNNPFESQLERLARTLTDQFGVKVACQGEEAWTDGTQIVLPSLPEPLEEDLERMVVGFLDHEMAHVAFSSFEEVRKFAEKHAGYEGMLNVVEDALIERRAMERWPGVRSNLNAMFVQIRDRVQQLLAGRNPFGRFCTAVYLKLSHHGDMLGLERLVQGYEDLFDWFPAIQDTRGASGLADQILERWLKQNPLRERQPASNAGNGAACVEDADSEGDAAASGGTEQSEPSSTDRSNAEDVSGQGGGEDGECGTEGPSSETTDARGDDREPQSGNKPEAAPSQCDAHANGSPSRQPQKDAEESDGPLGDETESSAKPGHHDVSLLTEALTEAITECVSQASASSEYRVFTKEFDRISAVPTASASDVRESCKQHVDVVRRLRRSLANALRSAEKRWWRDNQTNGTLSPRTLHRLCVDRPRLDVFRTQAMVQGSSAAVSILLDASGSMTRRKMEVARDAVCVLLEALADLKVETEALTFTTGNEFDLFRAGQLTGEDPSQMRVRCSRFANLEIGVVKHFEEPVKKGLARLPSICGTGLTPLGEAMHIAARRLHPRPQMRKILLVLTDGRAGCEARGDAAAHHAQHIARQIASAGIELIGVGIIDESLRAIVADTIVVHQLEDLPAQLCKLLGRTLQRGLRHVG